MIKKLLLAALLIGATVTARADTVRLQRGQNTFGQGWMFLDFDGVCKVVTAAHVVQGRGRNFIAPTVIGPHGNELTPGVPIVMPRAPNLSNAPDIAVLPLPGAQGPAGCGDGRLSRYRAEQRAAQLSNVVIFTTDRGEIAQVAAEGRGRPMDSQGGKIFAVRPMHEKDRVVEGWSGSPVVDNDGLIGIIFEVDLKNNEAHAVRVDVIRDLIDAAALSALPPVSAQPRQGTGVNVSAGVSTDALHGPGQLLLGGGDGWRVTPRGGNIVFSVSLANAVQIHEIVLGVTPRAALSGFGLSTKATPDDEDWAYAAYCRPHPTASEAVCDFAPRTIAALQLAIRVDSSAPITIQKFVMK